MIDHRHLLPLAGLLGALAAGCPAASHQPGAAGALGPSPAPAAEGGLAALLELPADRALVAGFVVVDGVYNTELMAPWDVFEHTRHHAAGQQPITPVAISPDGRPVRTAEGLQIVPHHGFADAPPIDILVVPSAERSRDADLDNDALIGFVRERGSSARFVMSLCWGAFVLARAGLLDGLACTTFPRDYKTFAEAFPAADLHVNVSYVHSGRLITSEGGARSYQAALYLVDLLYGERVAAAIGEGLLVPWPEDPELRPPVITDPVLQRLRR